MGALGVMHRALTTTVAVGLMAISACSRIAERAFARPTIAVQSVKLKSLGLSGGAIEIALAIANPNPYPLPVQRAVHNRFVRTSSCRAASASCSRSRRAAWASSMKCWTKS